MERSAESVLDRRSDVAQGHLRRRVGVVTTGLAAAALLSGPGATWALDVAGVAGSSGATSQLGATANGVVETAGQTAGSTVTDVATTVQTTAQATAPTTQAVTNQVQSTTGTVTAAPKAPAART